MEFPGLKIKTTPLLALGNLILLGIAWVEAVYAYGRLPLKIPMWLNLFGLQVILVDKSPLFFLYPGLQTFFVILFLLASRFLPLEKLISGAGETGFPPWSLGAIRKLKNEYILLALIFLNMIFIHIKTSLIYLAYDAEKGFSRPYFFGLMILLLLLGPYYKLRSRMILERKISL